MEKTIKLELTIPMINNVLTALSKMPLEQTLETFLAIRQQADSQVQELNVNVTESSVLNK
jgi:hypothetical protein